MGYLLTRHPTLHPEGDRQAQDNSKKNMLDIDSQQASYQGQ